MKRKLAAIVVIVLAAGARVLHGAPEPPANPTPPVTPAASEPTPPPPATPAVNGAPTPSPTASALNGNGTTVPQTPALNGYGAGCGGCCERGGSCLHRLIEWATYCPKERLGCCRNICNSCQYKGAIPLYLYVGKICKEAPYVRPTFAPPTCCHGCNKGCGSCNNCAAAAPCCGK